MKPEHESSPSPPPVGKSAVGHFDPPEPCTGQRRSGLDIPYRQWPAPPDDLACERIWDDFAMPEHIRRHSLMVADIATWLARRAHALGWNVHPDAVRASALLHDLAKDYSIRHGGNHAQLGGAWVLDITGNPLIAQGVVHHVFWPWEIDLKESFLPLVVIYADKRVKHCERVSLDTRFEDLFVRYGCNDFLIERISLSKQQSQTIEHHLTRSLGIDIHASTFDCGRLV